jgi:hypothetical protein
MRIRLVKQQQAAPRVVDAACFCCLYEVQLLGNFNLLN